MNYEIEYHRLLEENQSLQKENQSLQEENIALREENGNLKDNQAILVEQYSVLNERLNDLEIRGSRLIGSIKKLRKTIVQMNNYIKSIGENQE